MPSRLVPPTSGLSQVFTTTPISYSNFFLPCALPPLSSDLLSAPAAPEPAERGLAGRAAMLRNAAGLPRPPAGFRARRRRSARPAPRCPAPRAVRAGRRQERPPCAPPAAGSGPWARSLASCSLCHIGIPEQESPSSSCPPKILSPSSRSPPSAPSCLWPVREEPLLSSRDGAGALGAAGQGREGGLGSGDHPPGLSPLPGASGPAPRGQGCLDLSGVSWDPEVSDFSFFVLFWFFFPLLSALPKRL